MIGDETNSTRLFKVIPLSGLTSSLLTLNTFDFGIGINYNKCDYYLDDIVFVEKITSDVNTLNENNLNVYVHDNTLYISDQVKLVEIYDLNGKVILKTNDVSSVSITSLPQGLFITKIEVNDQIVVKKFIKLK